MLVIELIALPFQRVTTVIERYTALRQVQIGLLLSDLQRTPRRVVGLQRDNPFGQGCERGAVVASSDAQLLQGGEMIVPGLNQEPALALDFGIGLVAPFGGDVEGRLPVVEQALVLRMLRFGRPDLDVTLAQHGDLFASSDDQSVQLRTEFVEYLRRQFDQCVGGERGERIAAVKAADPRPFCTGRAIPTQIGQFTLGLPQALPGRI